MAKSVRSRETSLKVVKATPGKRAVSERKIAARAPSSVVLDADAASFEDDLTRAFKNNVREALQENKRVPRLVRAAAKI